MHTSDFSYTLPPASIAQRPAEPRDHARLMVVDKNKKTVSHRHFYDLAEFLDSGDVVVWNNSKVFKARLFGDLVSSRGERLRDHGKKVEIFLVRPTGNPGVWQVLARPGRHVQPGTKVIFAPDFFCEVMVKEKEGLTLVQFADDSETVRAKANRYGSVPIPPYIKDEVHELSVYQNVYAEKEGSVAAPTAGFHMTPALIETLRGKGVTFAEVTLHVGLGTFLPVKTERVEDHTMHSEWVEVSEEAAEIINRAKQEGRKIIAIGTTTVRTLEGVAQLGQGDIHAYVGDINIFITPGFEFRVVDAMVTNFHLPKSTLLMLVCAFAGDREFILDCYKKAVEDNYRFYSFGDAMFIHS